MHAVCKIQVRGEGPHNAKIILCGEAPGREEVEQKRPFVGRAGRFLNKTLVQVGIERHKCYITNVVKFRPTRVVRGKVKDRAPTQREISVCLPLLKREIAKIRPKAVVLLGKTAGTALIGTKKVADMRKKRVKTGKIMFVQTYHPAVAMRNRRLRAAFVEDLKKAKKICF